MAKKPADHKPAKNSLITIETSQGEVTLKKFAIKAGFLRKNRNKDEVELMFTMLEMHADDEALAVIDELEISELKDFFAEWQEESGALLGES